MRRKYICKILKKENPYNHYSIFGLFNNTVTVYADEKIVFRGYTFNLASGLSSVIFPISGRDATTVYGLWFLPCLFWAEVILYILLRWAKKWGRGGITLGYLILCLICRSVHKHTNIVSIIDILPIAVLYLGVGKHMQKRMRDFEERHLFIGINSGVLFLISVFLNYKLSSHSFDMSSMNLGIWPLYILSGIFGSFLIVALSMSSVSKLKLLKTIGRDSINYYGLHYEVIGIVEKIFHNYYFQTIVTMGALYIVAVPIYKKFCCYLKEKMNKNDIIK